MKKKIRVFIILLTAVFSAVGSTIPVWCWDSTDWSGTGWTTGSGKVYVTLAGYSIEKGYAPTDLDNINGEPYKNAMQTFAFLVSNGMTEIMAAGLVGNIMSESKCDPAKVESGSDAWNDRDNSKKGAGLIQWTPVNKLWDWAMENGYNSETVKGFECQCKCIIAQLSVSSTKNYIGGMMVNAGSAWEKLLETCDGGTGYSAKKNTEMAGTGVPSTVEACTVWYLGGVERPQFDVSHLPQRVEYAIKAYDEFSGMTYTPSVDGNGAVGVLSNGKTGIEIGKSNSWILGLEEFTDPYAVFGYESVPLSDINGLVLRYGEQKRDELMRWQKTVELERKENLLRTVRAIFVFLGVLMTVYSLILYMSYQFDKFNNIINIDLLSVLSFGKLRVAADESDSNFGDKDAKIKVLGHKHILLITGLSMAVGILMISGYVYKLLSALVGFVNNLFK